MAEYRRTRNHGRPALGARPAAALCLALGACGAPSGSGPGPAVEQALGRFETRDYFLPTMIASGPETVRDVILATPEMEILRAHPEPATPRVLAWLGSRNARGAPESAIPCFLYLETQRDPRAKETLLRWLEAAPEASRDELLSPWWPERFAIDALRACAPGAALPADDYEVYALRRELRRLPGLGP